MSPSSTLSARSRAYFNIDGLGELGLALFCLGYALFGYVQLHAPADSAWNRGILPSAFLLLLAAAIHFGTRAIKAKLTYPRTGYVEYRTRDTVWTPLLVVVPVAAVLAVAVLLAVRRQWDLHTIPVLLGALFTGSYAYGFARVVRWKWFVAGAMALSTLGIALLDPAQLTRWAEGTSIPRQLPPGLVAGILICMGVYGALLLISGLITLAGYVRQNHPQAPEAE